MTNDDLLTRVDRTLGESIDNAVVKHHRRRLKRIGRLDALDASGGDWAAGDPPPREGNELELLIDGAEALPRIAEAIRSAESSVELAGWHFEASFELERLGESLRELLAAAAERVDVRVLAWAGSPLPLFHPDRKDVREALHRLTTGTRIRAAGDSKERPMHCHHEKLVVVDGSTAFVGGIDLTGLGGDRFDRSDHPARGANGWHDAATRIRGPAVADVAEHIRLRWADVTGERLPDPVPPGPAGHVELQVVRTVPEHVYDALPRGDFRILESYLRAIRSAREFVYLESQFLWSPEIVDVLAEKLRNPPSDEFRLLVLLPAKPHNGEDDTRGQLGQLVEADGGDRFLACTLYQRDAGLPVYVHAKIGIVDDAWLTLGSANLNEHSLFNDTEMNVVCRDPRIVRAARLRLWAEHLECTPEELEAPVVELVDGRWRPRAEEQLEKKSRGEQLTARLARLPHVSRRSRRLLGPINGVLVDG
ncbi:MAG: phospholipase [Actinobacteria bacterium]|nr:MAG: phospholipase [Actinomycetota bacterium]